MRYTLLLGWLLLLGLPLTAMPPTAGAPGLQLTERYLQAFRHRYQALWPQRLQGQAAAAPARPSIGEQTVKTWTDARGVVHFSDARASPDGAQEKRITVPDNGVLWHGDTGSACLPPACTNPTDAASGLDNRRFAALTLLVATLALVIAHSLLRQLWRRLRPAHQTHPNDPTTDSGHRPSAATQATATDDPYRTLGVSANSSDEEIRQAYRRLMSAYHPDKVAHLGPALQETARQHSLAINAAWERIGRERGQADRTGSDL